MKLIHMSDLHLVPPGERLWGLDPLDRFTAALRDIARNQRDADLCVITGDLADRGEPEAYAALRAALENFPVPTVLLLGAHDNRDAFFAAFPDAPRPHGFAQSSRIIDGCRLLFLDTLDPGSEAGAFCEDRQAWLREALDGSDDLPVYIFAHHPPFEIRVPLADETRLTPAPGLRDLLAECPVHHIFFGHVHRPVFCTWQGILCSGVPGLAHQLPLVASSVAAPFSVEPPLYAIAHIGADDTIIHYDAFMHRYSADMRQLREDVTPAPASDENDLSWPDEEVEAS